MDRILQSISETAEHNHVSIVTGDTKTVDHGSADGIFINTAGIGIKLPGVELGLGRIEVGDKILINGTIGDHGMTIVSQREGIELRIAVGERLCRTGGIDVPPVRERAGDQVHAGPDARRLGGDRSMRSSKAAAGAWRSRNEQIPVRPAVQAAADMLGFDVLNAANEGKFVAVVSSEAAPECLRICREHPLGARGQDHRRDR